MYYYVSRRYSMYVVIPTCGTLLDLQCFSFSFFRHQASEIYIRGLFLSLARFLRQVVAHGGGDESERLESPDKDVLFNMALAVDANDSREKENLCQGLVPSQCAYSVPLLE
jgi:hypothetical protein